jgi:hypothetical protein
LFELSLLYVFYVLEELKEKYNLERGKNEEDCHDGCPEFGDVRFSLCL